MKKIVNIAIDIETLSLSPEAAIISLAAVPFMNGDDEIGEFYECVNATTCALYGMHFDMNTVRWWAGCSEEAKAEFLSHHPMCIQDVMTSFHAYLEGIKEKYDADLRVWAQGTDFDIPILKNAYSKVLPGVDYPWKHTELRDSRTFILSTLERHFGRTENPYDKIPPMPDGEEWVKHSALSDVRKMIWNISYCCGLN